MARGCTPIVALAVALVFLITPGVAGAHQRGMGSYIVEVVGQVARWVQRVDAVDVGTFLRLDGDGDGVVTQVEIDEARPRIEAYVAERLSFATDGVDCGPAVVDAIAVDAPVPHWLDIRGRFECPQPMGVVEVGNWVLFDYSRDYRHFVELSTPDGVVQRLLGAEQASIRVRLGPSAAVPRPSGGESLQAEAQEARSGLSRVGLFVKEGILHIFIGFDHILFILGLTIAAPNLKRLAVIVTSFTLAHSITLALASLEIVRVDVGLAESLIALSVAYVGLENILREPRHRWLLAFGFGLIHGVGFSSVLRDLVSIGSMGGAERAELLVGFNVGVEVGQLAIVTAAFPVFAGLRRYGVGRAVRIGVSAAILVAGAYWFVTRAF